MRGQGRRGASPRAGMGLGSRELGMIWGEPHHLRGTRLTPEKWPVSRTPAASAARQRRGVRCGTRGARPVGSLDPGPAPFISRHSLRLTTTQRKV